MKIFFIVLILIAFFLNGCIVFKSVSYEITLTEQTKGSSVVTIEDICTDAKSEEELIADKELVFDFITVSADFIEELGNQGKKVISRNLFVKENKLNGIINYQFDNITEAESIEFEDPYYYLTLSPQDSIISTNGQIFKYEEYQRIVWDKSIKTLKFKIFSEDTEQPNIKSLVDYYKK